MDPDFLVRAWFHEVWDEGREEAIDRLMAHDAIVHGLGGGSIRGPKEFKPFFHAMRNALGDLEVTVERTIVQGDTVAAHCHVVARHVGETLGGPATGKTVDFSGSLSRGSLVGSSLRDGTSSTFYECISRWGG